MRRGTRHSPESIAKMRAAKLGDKNPAKRPDMRALKRAFMMGDKNPMKRPESRKKLGDAVRGRKKTKAHRAKLRAARLGKKASPKTRARLRVARMGNKNHQWRGGVSREPYGWDFNEELKEEVRRRDGHKCQLCGVPQKECYEALTVHHIDYNKKDNDPLNLTALCRSCHSRTNARRAYWAAFFGTQTLDKQEKACGHS